MKNLIYLFVLLFFTTILFAQSEEEEELGPNVDLIVQTNDAEGYEVQFELVPVSTLYCWSSVCSNFNTTSATSNNTIILEGTSNCVSYGYNYRRCGDDTYTITPQDCGTYTTVQPLRSGFYRMNIYVNEELAAYFYYDNRDADLPKGSCWTYQNPIYTCFYPMRSSIHYNLAEDKLFYHNNFSYQFGPQYGWHEFPKESIIFLREWKVCDPQNFSPFWENGLVVIPQKNQSTGIYEPYIVWGPHYEFQPTGYKIYYREGGTGNFSLLQTVSASTYEYRHVGLAVGSGILYEYKVQAYNNQSSSDFTNTVSINTDGFYKSNPEVLNNTVVKEYELGQNFPNPFNPITTIGYKVMNEGFISIKIYDILGNEVKTLVNEVKSPGMYNVNWEGDNNLGEKLTSGVYFYHMQAGNYSSSKKLVIQK